MKGVNKEILVTVKMLVNMTSIKTFSLFAFHFSLLVFCCLTAAAQEDLPPEGSAPPPLNIISKQEKSSLEAETDISERTKLSLLLMETRLKNAEDLSARNSYSEMSDQLGGFNALMDNALNFLNQNDNGRGKVLNNFKRLEISLRKFTPRLELIRRELPFEHEFYVRRLIKKVRAARSKAVEPFFDDTVVPNGGKGN